MIINKPPMGWNSWNTFGAEINEELIMEMADKIVELGYKDAGYDYIIIDDCWSEMKRNENGELVCDKKKFPHGMKYISDYIHSKGLKFGMYTCVGVKTCAGYPSSFGYEFIDAKTFASWEIDYLKCDFGYFPFNADCKQIYKTMAMALQNSGRDILFSACNWGKHDSVKWMNSIGAHTYRSTGDIFDSFTSFRDIFVSQVKNLPYTSIGSYNDMDMLIVGMNGKGNVAQGGCTEEEYKSHFALWCLFQSPLIIGADIRNLDDFAKNLLLNKELIKINQDSAARPCQLVYDANGIWYSFIKELSDGDYILAYFNASDEETQGQIFFYDIGLPVYSKVGLEMTDLFTGESLGVVTESYTPTLAPHCCKIYRAKFVDLP